MGNNEVNQKSRFIFAMGILDELFGNGQEPQFNGKSLFKDDNESTGVFVKSQFIQDVRSLKAKHPSQLQHIKRLVENMNLKRKLKRQPVVTYDNGEAIIWSSFHYGNTGDNLRIVNINGIYDLIKQYADGKIAVTQTFEELLQSAAGEI